MLYNVKYYHSNKLHSLSPKRDSLWHHICTNGEIIGMFQGSRGLYPEIDFQIKVLLPGVEQKMFTPSHGDWSVDLLIKSHFYPEEISEILNFYIDFYDNTCIPFSSQVQRNTHDLVTVNQILSKYSEVSVPRTLSIDAVATLLELFCYCEKRNQPVAHQFRDALERMKAYSQGIIGIVDVMHLVYGHF